jgi:hypothetical protein
MTPENALQTLLDRLDEFGIPFMITGSFASNAHGVPRVTQDADVIIETDVRSLLRMMKELEQDFFGDAEAAREAFATTRILNLIHRDTGFKIDIILRKPRPFSLEEFKRRRKINFLGRDRWFATPEDTILAKLEWSKMGESERQFADAVQVARVQGDRLDKPYLEKWAPELSVANLLRRLFSELRRD